MPGSSPQWYTIDFRTQASGTQQSWNRSVTADGNLTRKIDFADLKTDG